jgi:hypothetical protein
MHLVEIFLPTKLPSGRPVSDALWTEVRDELVAGFGGLTARDDKPAKGIWQDEHDQILIIEIMCEELEFKERIERAFQQDEILIRAIAAERL